MYEIIYGNRLDMGGGSSALLDQKSMRGPGFCCVATMTCATGPNGELFVLNNQTNFNRFRLKYSC